MSACPDCESAAVLLLQSAELVAHMVQAKLVESDQRVAELTEQIQTLKMQKVRCVSIENCLQPGRHHTACH